MKLFPPNNTGIARKIIFGISFEMNNPAVEIGRYQKIPCHSRWSGIS